MKANKNLIALIVIVVVAIAVTILAVFLNSIERGKEFEVGDFTVISEGSGVSITKYNGKATSVVIPEKLDRKKVVSIGAGAFLGSDVTEVSFSSNASNVELANACFANNTKITKVILPSNLKIIPRDCFSGCSSLLEVSMPNSIEYIGQYAFNSCTKFTRDYAQENTYRYLTLPSNLKEICEYAFNSCTSLDGIKITDKLEIIGDSAFRESGLQKIILQDSENQKINITSIGKYAFYKTSLYSKSATDLEMEKLETIGDYAFASITVNFEQFVIPASVKTIGESAFAGSNILKSVEIKQNENTDQISIGKNTFANCTRLTSVILPNKITEIPSGMFIGCIRLLSVNDLILGEKVNKIGAGAFALFASSSSDRLRKDYAALNGVFKTIKFSRLDSEQKYDRNDIFRIVKLDSYVSGSNNYNHFIITENESNPKNLYAYVGQFNTLEGEDKCHYDNKLTDKFAFFFSNNIGVNLNEIQTISDYAFAGSQFASILLPGSICNIGENAFYKADVSSIYFESDSVNRTFYISDKAFDNTNNSDIKFLIFGGQSVTNSSLARRLEELGKEVLIAEPSLN